MIGYFVDKNKDIALDSFETQSWAFGMSFMSDGLLLRDLAGDPYRYLYRCEITPRQVLRVIEIPTSEQIEHLKEAGYDVLVWSNTLYAPYLQDDMVVDQYIVFNPDCVTILDCQSIKKTLKESLILHSQLNSKLFSDNHLKDDVRERLIDIGDDFVHTITEDGVPLKVCDYWLVGSNAAYNYQPDSDIDLHIIVNMEDLDVDEKILRLLYDYIKSSWSQKYDITIKGHPLEIYLEDSRTSSASNGIYSIRKNKWIKIPEPQEDKQLYPEESDLYREWLLRYKDLRDDEVEQFIDDLYLMRKEALASEGEFALGNLIFKEFRNSGRLDALKSRRDEIKSRELTLESLTEAFSLSMRDLIAEAKARDVQPADLFDKWDALVDASEFFDEITEGTSDSYKTSPDQRINLNNSQHFFYQVLLAYLDSEGTGVTDYKKLSPAEVGRNSEGKWAPLDGRHRAALCKQLGIDLPVVAK